MLTVALTWYFSLNKDGKISFLSDCQRFMFLHAKIHTAFEVTCAHFSRSLKLLTGIIFACYFDQENPNCTSQIVCQQETSILLYILIPNLTCLEQNYCIKNACKIREFLHHICVSHFCYTWQCRGKVKHHHFCVCNEGIEFFWASTIRVK